MKELIVALRACLEIAVNDDIIDHKQAKLVADHIDSLIDLTIRNDAIELIKSMVRGKTIPHDTAAGALAKVTVMLTLYGSKPDAMLAVLHDKGWGIITLDDVNAVRTFILEQ